MEKSTFIYVTYIKTTPEELWKALTTPAILRKFWFDCTVECDWTPGSRWKLTLDDGKVADSGHIVEIEKPHRIVIHWNHEWQEELKSANPTTCTMLLEPVGETVKLTVIHETNEADSKFITQVGIGWPGILSGLKTLLEVGEPLKIELQP